MQIRNEGRKLSNKYFLVSTFVNTGNSGYTVEATLYRVENVDFLQTVSNLYLLFGTNNLVRTSAATMAVTLIQLSNAI